MTNRGRVLWLAAVLAAAAVLPVAGSRIRADRLLGWPPAGCALDGQPIVPEYAVRVVDGAGGEHRFCCITCADFWVRRSGERSATVFVTDEASGVVVPAPDAVFVRSFVVTHPTTGNRIHAFRHREDAERHREEFRGSLLEGTEKPFAR